MEIGKISCQVSYLEAHPDLDILGGGLAVIDHRGEISHTVIRKLSEEDYSKKLKYECLIAHPTVVFRKDAVLKAGGYSEKFLATEDFELWSRMRKKFKISAIEDLVILYRIHNGTQSLKLQEIQEQERKHIVIRNMYPKFLWAYVICKNLGHKKIFLRDAA